MTPPAEPALSGRGVSLSYGGVQALRDVDFDLPTGQITCIIGGNGAGKSTLLDVLSGFRQPDAGQVLAHGVDVTAWSIEKRARHGVVRLFQYGAGFRGLRLDESAAVGLRSTSLRPFERPAAHARRLASARRYLAAVGFDGGERGRVRTASFGQQRRTALAAMLAAEPEVLLIDEPTAGLDPRVVAEMEKVVRSLKELGKTVGLVEHNLTFVRDVADSVCLMERGTIVKWLGPQDVFDDLAVQRELLGGSVDN